ncbi:hypothetical protein GOP47_0004079 [Adiantum capillus-veneris]|uniref:Homologous recombination OB-fold protein OB-fold domain-containing protein n=1 Tax=Adiantum capillus-veneris TaxID=13818 RepID=A0A9D4V6U6_ADICA|nr:hypothetical protein GOP47_0004079 [Adiantum capillus-veneris]
MASWADEFDIDDSDILGALNNRRKDPSQLVSPPWPLAAAVGPRPPHLPLTSSSADPQHSTASSASLLKRFQRPRASQNEPSLFQNLASSTFDTQRKRKLGVDSAPSQAACREGRSLYDSICGEDSSDGALTGNDISTVEEHCHSLSSHGKSLTAAEGEISRSYSRNVQSQNGRRQVDLVTSQQPLTDIMQNIPIGNRKVSNVALDAHQSVMQNSNFDRMQQTRTCAVQVPGNGGGERSKRVASVSQQGQNLEKRLKTVHEKISEQIRAPNSIRKLVSNRPSADGNRREARSVRFLQKDLHYHIPGPAGAVQRSLGQNGSSFSDNSTMKDNAAQCRASVVDDTDFQSGPWLKAKNYLEKSPIQVSTISSLKTSRTENRVLKLLAVIKTCLPNGCGDAVLNLKDQTDTINGIVNRRVLSETEFGRIMEPGAVILLHQVAVFSPTPYAHYLNITVNNVEQVFSKESKFFKGECSRGASKAAIDTTEDELMEDVHSPARCNSRMEDLCAEKPGENAHSKIDELLEEEDELEILLARSAQRTTQGWPVQDELEVPVKFNTGRGFLSGSPLKDQIDDLHPNTINDGYDQLLDDISLFP